MIASASFFVVCTPSDSQDITIKEFPKPAFGSWGGIAPKMKEVGVAFGESNPLSKLGYHKANNLKLDFDHEEGTELMVDCKQYTSHGCILIMCQYGPKFMVRKVWTMIYD